MTRNGASPGRTVGYAHWLNHMRTGTLLAKRGEAALAVVEFARAVTLRPNDVATRRQLAAALFRAGEHESALDLFDTLIAEGTGSSDDLHGRGLALTALGRAEEAMATFKAALKLNTDAWRSAASIADISPDEAERVAALDTCADILHRLCKPGTSPCHFDAAAGALADAHRYLDLLEFARCHSGCFSDPARAYDWLAKSSYELGRFDEALDFKQSALHRTPVPLDSVVQRSGFNTGEALEALDEVTAILENQGLTVFPVAGTLLGLRRSGAPLAHDRDIDIGIFASPEAGPDVAQVVRKDPRLILARSARPGDRYFALMHRGIAIDIFVHELRGDFVTCGVSHRPGDIQWRFSRFSLQHQVIGGRLWCLPHPANRYLAENYGPDWRTPDKGFASAVSSPALFGADIRVRSFYAAARARSALLSGDAGKARALVRQSPLKLRLPEAATGEEDYQ